MLEKIKNKHLLIDGDIVKYRCAASAEKTRYLVERVFVLNTRDYDHFDSYREAVAFCKEEEKAHKSLQFTHIWSRKEVQPLEFALQACKTTLDAFIAKLTPSKVSIFLSPARNFRDDIARTKSYKGNRTQPKPKYLKDVEEYLIKVHGAVVGNNIEADDEIGRTLSAEGDGAVSVSIDKDLLQVPGWHYNWVNDRIQRISPKRADINFYSQMLTGDVTDNIPGLPGIGPARAAQILDGIQSRADAATRVWSSYRKFLDHPDTEFAEAREYFLEQAQLLWILRAGLNEGKEGTGNYVCPIELS